MGHIRDIVIAGGGVAGWMSALALANARAGERVTLVETGGPDHSLGPFGPAEATLPEFAAFLIANGIDEDALMRAARGSFSLGGAFSGWAGEGVTWFLPHGETGAPIGPVAFHHLAARLRAGRREVRLADFSLAAVAAQSGRFARPSADRRSPLSALGYGLHLDRAGFAALLRDRALAAGVAAHPAPLRAVRLAGDGSIAAIETGPGEVAGDLFLDCTGPGALLIGGALGVGFDGWSQWLPCDRAIEWSNAAEGVPPPYAHSGAFDAGWRRMLPLARGQGEALVYSSAHLDDAAASAAFGGAAPVPVAFGRRASFWRRNCVAIGAAAALFDPLHGTALQLVHSALRRLIALFPHAADGPEGAEFDRIQLAEADRARDFLILHYKTNGRKGDPMWDAARAMAVPDPLQYKLDLYASRGRLPVYDEELFDRPEWIAVLDGQGVRQRRYDALADAIPEPALMQHFGRLREVILQAAKQLPGHGAALAAAGVRA
ncbi:tryptophan halogenase family protein [Sphingomonas canadensis]|uniref:Tryptophan halogenase family protein n=1 Tax=Sphingomonas canadensis TaxID=1219257 RepID=A0ABW3H2Z0_9SPHN|nr:tryptophan halogenase family protein [Sphingomonas canadensis]MCW3835713.1 tryptophan 7-halogenase [Sphingomonas canadensis]